MITSIIIMILLCLVTWVVCGNLTLKISRYEIKTGKVKGNLTILQISDFHACKRFAEKVINTIEKEAPDIIVFTGDFLDEPGEDIAPCEKVLKTTCNLKEKTVSLFVTGNHEAFAVKNGALYELLEKYDIQLLFIGKFCKASRDVFIYGIDDPFVIGNEKCHDTKRFKEELSSISMDKSKFNILLSHRPEMFEEYAGHGFDLVVSGHAHGGQVRVPGIGGLYAPGQGILPKLTGGRVYKNGGTSMIVSRGIGDSSFPVRINNAPEVVITTIKPNR